MTEIRARTIALLGNPNTGKSTLFQALTGVSQKTGNFPGCTVEKKVGRMKIAGVPWSVVDLPGTYSLAPRSPDEMIAVDVLLGRRSDVPAPDVILCIVDASNLQRNLFLVHQALELGRPLVLALNMQDLAERRGIQIDIPRLSRTWGIPVVPVQAHRRIGIDELKQALANAVGLQVVPPDSVFPPAFQREQQEFQKRLTAVGVPWPPYLVERLLLDSSGYLLETLPSSHRATLGTELRAARKRLAAEGCPIPAIEAVSRYGAIADQLDGVIGRKHATATRWSDRWDRVLTHRWWGTVVFLAVMMIIFQAVFSWATPAMEIIESAIGGLGSGVERVLPSGPLRSLLVDGVIAGFGGVVVFLPQIVILFAFVAILEDCGYLARAAYLMDRPMSRMGLSGKSFIPLLSSFACAIPGIMATRVIENRRDRLLTILVAPLMSCSARLPVYTLLIGTFVPQRSWAGGWIGLQAGVMFAAYSLGVIASIGAAAVFGATLLRGEKSSFVMELPPYKVPSWRVVLARVWDRGWAFVARAGTLIVAISILVWAAAYFPRDSVSGTPSAAEVDRGGSVSAGLTGESEFTNAHLRQSYLGRAGRWLEPVFRPLGWDWRIGCAVLASFPAREVVIGVMGVLYNLGDDEDESSSPLRQVLPRVTWEGSDRKVYTLPVALSLIVFFALCAQCASTLVTIWRETQHGGWAALTFGYMTALAYVAALVTYQLGTRLGW